MRGTTPFRVVVIALLLARPMRAQTVTDLFDDSVLHEVRVTMTPADWQSLHENYLDNTYYRCRFEWRDIVLDNVGVRSRGSGTRNPLKPNLGFDFSKYVSSQRFLSLKSLVTRNFAQDPSLMREWLTMKLFTRLGLPAQRESFARLVVNGEYAGLFLLVEPVDKRYLLSRFGEDTGYLYEGAFADPPYQFEYLGDDPALYLPHLLEPKTHEDTPEGERVVAFIKTVNQASDTDFVRLVSPLADLDEFVSYLAVEQYVSEVDGFLGYAGMTNYYLYRRMADNRFTFIPWDKDNAFAITERSIWANTQGNVLARRVLAVPELRQRFLQTVAHAGEIAGGAGGWLMQERERGLALIREAALADPARVCAVDGVWQVCPWSVFEQYQSYLAQWIGARNQLVGGELTAAGFETDPAAPDYLAGAAKNLGLSNGVLTPGALGRLTMTCGMTGTQWALAWPLPLELGGVTVTLADRPVPLVGVSPGEVIFQVPWDVTLGPQPLRATWRGQAGHGINVDIRPGGWATLALTHADWRAVGESAPVRAGEWLVLFGTGLASPRVPMKTGQPAPPEPTTTAGKVTVQIGDRAARVIYAGWTPGSIGLSQIVFEVPPEMPAGPGKLVVCVNDEPGPAVMIPVR